MRNFYAYFKCIIFYIYISSYIFTYWILLDLNANFICILYSCFTPIGWFSYLEEGSQIPETRNQVTFAQHMRKSYIINNYNYTEENKVDISR